MIKSKSKVSIFISCFVPSKLPYICTSLPEALPVGAVCLPVCLSVTPASESCDYDILGVTREYVRVCSIFMSDHNQAYWTRMDKKLTLLCVSLI